MYNYRVWKQNSKKHCGGQLKKAGFHTTGFQLTVTWTPIPFHISCIASGHCGLTLLGGCASGWNLS